MDDEDEVKQSSSTVEQPIAEAPEVGETRVSEQCDVVLSVEDDSVKSLSMANNAENVEESKVEDAKVEEMVPAVVVGSEDAELEVRNEKVVEERENEGANVEESKSEVAKVETDGEGSVEKLVADDDVVGMKEDELVEEKKEEEALIEEAKEEELAVKANEEASNYKLKEEEELVEEKKEEEALVEEAKEEELIEEEKEEELAVEAKEEELAVEANEEASNYKSKEEEELVDGAKEEVIEEASIKESKEEGLVEEASIKELKEEGLVEEAREEALIEESKEEELVEEAKEEELIEEQKEEALDEDMKQDESIEEKVENENKGEHSEDVVMVKEEGEDRLKTENLVEVECGDEAAKADKVVQEGGEEVEKGDDEEEDGGGKEMEDSEGYGDEEVSRMVVEDEEVVKEEEMPNTDTEMEKESEVVKSGSGGKRRRGRSSKLSTPVKSPAKSPSRKTVGEDVCFICLDGGDLVLCDRRGCPKAYHPSCVDHDEEFFKTKGRWNCGWHLCNQCGKNAYFLCYTCTFSLCKGCSKDAVIFCLRGSKGFCESCMKTVMMIESNEQNEMGAAFDDKSSWEYLFKDYWIEQKAKLGISSDELAQAKNPLRDYDASDRRQKPVELDDNDDVGTDSDNSPANIEMSDSKRKRAKRTKPVGSGTDSSSEEAGTAKKKSKRRLKSQAKDTYSDPEHTLVNQGTSRGKRVRRLSKSHSKDGGAISGEGNIEWASQELLEFVMHMKNGDSSVLTQFDVQGLLLEYIKRNKLRDPRRQSQIICDSMLQKLFGKARVGHFEMLKLLESHFLLKEDSHVDDNQGNVVDTEISPDDHNDDSGKMRGRKSRKRAEDRGQSNLEDYAAIDRHNISLIYLRRGLMESLMDDADMFHEKVIGSFVRIRISGSNQKQDIYRLVQIVGTSKAPEAYKVGKRTTDAMLEILNLDKTEIVSIDSISNQEFTEDECKRLRQSIKCGLISRMTVGDVLEKARELQEVRVTDWLEAEIVRLSHLRDRASEKGRKKELRECVEKLQLLKTPEERQRRLNETPEVHADPKMDPSCVSDDENENLDKRQASNIRPRDSGFFRRSRDNFSSRKVGSVSNDSWSANVRPSNQTTELGRNLSNKGVSGRREDSSAPSLASDHSWSNGVDRGTPRSNNWEKPKIISDTPMSTQVEHSGRRSDLSVAAASEPVQPSSAAGQIDVKVNETEKTWHYRDPTGKVQGPFSMSQLRKWSNTGYFPAQLRIWRTSQMEDDSILLTEALDGKFQKESQTVMSNSDVGSKVRNTPSSVDTVKLSGSRYDSTILPSPTPTRSPAAWSGKQTSSIFQSTAQFRGNERLPSPTPTSPSSDPSSVDRSNIPQQSKGNVVGNRQENVVASIGTVQPAPAQFASNSGMASAQQFSSQSVLNVANQPFAPPDAAMNQTIVGPNAVGCGQGFSNMVQPGTGQNPPIYTQNWGAGYVARPEMVNANLTPNNQTAVQPAQYSQWTGASVGNQAPPYAGGYPPGQGNIAANFPAMPMNTAWRPGQTNMSWAGQQQQLQLQQQQQQLQLQQQPVGQNAGWTGPSSGSMAQMAPSPSTPAMAPGPASAGWSGTGPSPTPGNTNMVWVGAPGNSGTWGGDQNRNGGGTQPQWNRQSSFGSGGQRVCKYFREHGNCRKGSSCDYMHT